VFVVQLPAAVPTERQDGVVRQRSVDLQVLRRAAGGSCSGRQWQRRRRPGRRALPAEHDGDRRRRRFVADGGFKLECFVDH